MGIKKMFEKKLEILNIAQNINVFQIFAFFPIFFKPKIKTTQGVPIFIFYIYLYLFVNEAFI